MSKFSEGNRIVSVAFHPTDPVLAVATRDRVSLWSIQDSRPLQIAVIPVWTTFLKFSPDGTFLATASHDNTARVWDLRNENREVFRVVHEFWVGKFEFCGDSNRVVTACGHQALTHPDQASVRVWNLTHAWRHCVPFPSAVYFLDTEGKCELLTDCGVPVVANGKLAVVSNVAGADSQPLGEFAGEFGLIDISMNGKAAILRSKPGEYDAPIQHKAVGSAAARFNLPAEIAEIDLSDDGSKIVCCNVNRLTVHTDSTTHPIFEKAFETNIEHARFSPDGQWIGVSLRGVPSIVLLRLLNGSIIASQNITIDSVPSVTGYDLKFSHAGNMLIVSGHDCVSAWQVSPQLKCVFRIDEEFVNAGALSRDGRYLALKASGQDARIVDLSSKEVIATVVDEEKILTCAFSADGQFLATGSGDLLEQPKSNSVRIWDVKSGRLLFQVTETVNPLELAFDRSGDQIVVRKQNATIEVYNWKTEALVSEVATRLRANMSPKLWGELLPGIDYRRTFDKLPIAVDQQ